MNEIQYVGEHLWPGYLGQGLNILSFVAAILGAWTFYKAFKNRDNAEGNRWERIGISSFWIHGISTLSLIGLIFFVMINQYYEYQYVQAHVSEDLPMKYIFSAFWEGQEGSFLLWMFWHIILGGILIFTAGKWRAPVLFSLCLIEIFIGSMILGVYLPFGEDIRMGSSPILLLRDVMNAPIFAQANYLELVQGTGLNPLLQNYWMTIHPPTLFLGFASTAVPFCFAIAGLMSGEHKAWLKPVFPWALFSGAILGTGILMGGAWAYEALSFGGYWAWDPVENMSLVPWLILIAGLHGNAVAKATGYSTRSTYLFYILTFGLIVYSTFLTRSGVLGETSVHAFTEMGLEAQLIAFIVFFMGMGIWHLAKNWKAIPAPKKEEALSSKEFWMFIGSLVLLFSGLIITVSTSFPVFNKIVQIFAPAYQGVVITEPIPHYNKYQLWIGVFIGLLAGFSQYLRFRETNFERVRKKFLIQMGITTVVSLIGTYLLTLWIQANAWQYLLLLFAGVFAIVTNLDYLIRVARFNINFVGSSFSHLGFGIMILGVLASGLNKKFISSNPLIQRNSIEDFTEDDYRKNILLFKDVPMFMNGYEVTYQRDTFEGFTRRFNINYKKLGAEGKVIEEFDLEPNILYAKTFDKIAASNPATHHYLSEDIFTYISSIPKAEMDRNFAKDQEDSLKYILYEMEEGANFETPEHTVTVGNVNRNPVHHDYEALAGDLALGLPLKIKSKKTGESYDAEPLLVLRKDFLLTYPVQINELNVKVKLAQQIIENYYQRENTLNYNPFKLLKGESINFNGYQVTFENINSNPESLNYQKEEGDIAIAAQLKVSDKEGNEKLAKPIFFIRGKSSFSLKDFIPEFGLHLRFESVDPTNGSIKINLAQRSTENIKLPIELAENSLRTDYIVLQAILFPGINLFWLGSIMMMLGMLIAMYRRIKQRYDYQ